MKLTPAQKWAAKNAAAAHAEAARQAIAEQRAPEPMADAATTMAALVLNLDTDLARLSGLPVAEKIKLKAELLPGYMAAVAAYEQAGEVYANPVLVRVIIWLFDLLEAGHSAGDILTVERLSMLAVEQGQHMPDRFNRDLPTFVSDAFLAWAKLQIDQNHSPEPIFSRVFEQVKIWPVPQVVLMKYHKAAANIAIDSGDDIKAIGHMLEAQKLGTTKHPAKITTALANAKKRLEKQGMALPSGMPEPDETAETDTDTDTEHPGSAAATDSAAE